MARAYWLVKSEPSVYPWSRLEAEKVAVWDGVRNFEARNNLRAMKKGTSPSSTTRTKAKPWSASRA